MNTKQLSFLLLLGLASCQTSTTTSPLSEGQGGAASGGSSGASGEASGAAGEAGAGGNSGSNAGNSGIAGSSGGGAEDPATLCEGACTRLTTCTGLHTYTVDIPKCTAQCVKEVTGQGSLTQEIGLDFYTTMRDGPDGCSHTTLGIQEYWVAFFKQPEKLKALKEPQVLQACVDALWECYQGDKSQYEPGCFKSHYRYNTDIREKLTACYKQKCPDREFCAGSTTPDGEPWFDGITENVQ